MITSREGQTLQHFVRERRLTVTDNELVDVLGLRYPNNQPIVTLDDRDTFREICEMFRTLSVTEMVAFLKVAPDREFVIFEQPGMRIARERHLRSIINSTAVTKTIKGLGRCPECKSENIRLVGGRQSRSIDEITGTNWECASCPAQWSRK